MKKEKKSADERQKGPIIKFQTMTPGLFLIHLLNFMAPALFLALGFSVLELIFNKKRPLSLYFIESFAIYFIVLLMVSCVGLVLLERDGKVLTYAGLVGVSAAIAAWRTR
jgi:small-conductance mechanosensitive channel